MREDEQTSSQRDVHHSPPVYPVILNGWIFPMSQACQNACQFVCPTEYQNRCHVECQYIYIMSDKMPEYVSECGKLCLSEHDLSLEIGSNDAQTICKQASKWFIRERKRTCSIILCVCVCVCVCVCLCQPLSQRGNASSLETKFGNNSRGAVGIDEVTAQRRHFILLWYGLRTLNPRTC